MKRLFVLLIAMALCLSVATGALAEFTLSEPGEFPIVEGDVVELDVLYSVPSFITDINTNYATQWYEEKTGVHVNWKVVSGADYVEKLSLMLATNSKADMPDVFLGDFSREIADAYGAQGILLDLTDLIEKYGVNMKALKEHNPGFVDELVSYDGGIYFLSRYYETVHMRHTQKIWMNMKWLENVGMDVPTTTEEFYEVLKAFKEQDANGNGDPNDEIPMVYYTGLMNSEVPAGLMQSFVYDPGVNTPRLYVEDGTVKASYAEEGWREGLRYIKRLYDEGLVDNELFSLTMEQGKALAADPNGTRVGVVVGVYNGLFDTTSEDIFDYEVIEPLEGPTGLRQTALEFVSPSPYFAISAYCENPEVAYRWADAMLYDSSKDIANGDYTWLNFWYGEQGVGWDVADEGAVGFTGEPAAFKWLFTWGDKLNTHWYENFLINMPEGWKPLMQAEVGEGYNMEKVLYEETVEKEAPYSVDKTLHMPSLEEDVAVEQAALKSDLETYVKSMMASFIRGEADLDADWDKYLAELDNIGLQQYLSVYQEALNR